MESVLPGSNKINLELHGERAMYSIGEPIRPKLQILNNTAQKIELGYGFIFNWENLAFAEPNFIHLIGPNSAELALPYCREKSYFDSINPITLDAGKQEWLYLPINAHFHLRELGEYSFWLDLLDNNGELCRSNRISFRLVDIEASVPVEFIELTIKSRKPSFMATEPIDIEAIFTNKSDKPIIFLKPQEDSLDGWVNPVYQFTVVDSADRSLALTLRCGSMATPVYNDSTQFIIASGEFYRQTIQLPSFPDMQNPGEYRVRLTYIVRGKAIGKGGVVLDKQMNWEKEVFVGRIESNEVTISIKGEMEVLSPGTFRIPAESVNHTHVTSSIAMIADAATLAGSGYAVVLGCGKCMEIPVSYLSTIFKRVDLVDVDSDALKSVETQFQECGQANNSCILYHSDLTGLIPEIESNACDIAAKTSGPLTCLDRLGELLASATPSFWGSRNNEKYNLVICSAVLTQLQATVRNRVENIFLDSYGGHASLLSSHEQWRRHIWNFARQLEDGFVTHLKTLMAPEAIIYISDTVRVCFAKQNSDDSFSTEGSWITLKTNRLADYFDSSYQIIKETSWTWFLPKIENNSDGRLYEVQALVLRSIRS